MAKTTAAKAGKRTAVAPWQAVQGVYQDGAIEVVADGLKIHWAKLPPPDRLYEADFAWIRLRYGAVSLLFGKEDLNEEKRLRTRLEIRYPGEKFLHHFWKNSREFHKAIRELPNWSDGDTRGRIEPEKWTALKDHSESANFEYMARFGSEAVLDFYYVAPSGIARLAQGMGASGVRVDPVVRVQTTRSELLHLLDAAEPIVQELEHQLPEDLRNDQ